MKRARVTRHGTATSARNEGRAAGCATEREPTSNAAAQLIGLQRAAGNHAVASLLSRPEPTNATEPEERVPDARLHTDADAQRVAMSHDASAVTIGRDIFFGPGRYRPDANDGARLLAHELAHVVQQLGPVRGSRSPVARGKVALEQEARSFGEAVAGARSIPVPSLSSGAAPAGVAQADPAGPNDHHMRGQPGETGVGVVYVKDWANMSADDRGKVLFWAREVDVRASGGVQRQAVTPQMKRDAKSVQGLAQRSPAMGLGPTDAAGHSNDMTAGGDPLGPIVALPKGVNSSIGPQWKRYRQGFTFTGVSVYDHDTGQWLYVSHAVEHAPPPMRPGPPPRAPAAPARAPVAPPVQQSRAESEPPSVRPPAGAPTPPSGQASPGTAPDVPPRAPAAATATSTPKSATAPRVTVQVKAPGTPAAPKTNAPGVAPRVDAPAPSSSGLVKKVDTSKLAHAEGLHGRVTSSMKGAAAGLALDFLTNLIKARIGQEMAEQQIEAQLAKLGPAIDAMLATNPKQIHAVIGVTTMVVTHDVITDHGVDEKSGYPMVFVTVELSDHAVRATETTKSEDLGALSLASMQTTNATYSVLILDVEAALRKQEIERDEAKLNERIRALAKESKEQPQAPRPASAPPAVAPPNNALLPPAPAAPKPLLPGAPPPSVNQEEFAEYARGYGKQLLAEGTRLRDTHAPSRDRDLFMRRVQVWRGQMRKLIREFGNARAKDSLTTTLLSFDEKMSSLGSELGIDQWRDE
jgi:hypothetical protein